MSKQLSALLLQNRVNKIKQPSRRKQYLIDCLQKQGLILEEIDTVPISKIEHDTCRICNSSSIIRSNHELICGDCGATDTSVSFNPSLILSEFG